MPSAAKLSDTLALRESYISLMHRSVFSSASRSASCFKTGPLLTGDVIEEFGAERFGERLSGVTGAECPKCRRVVAGDADAERTVLGVVGGL